MVDNNWTPLIGSDRERLLDLAPIAREVADAKGIIVRLAKFTTREEVETIIPKKSDGHGRVAHPGVAQG